MCLFAGEDPFYRLEASGYPSLTALESRMIDLWHANLREWSGSALAVVRCSCRPSAGYECLRGSLKLHTQPP
jgi:hypothetical protein